MLGYDVEKLNKELEREENSLLKKLAISSPVITYGSIVADKKALLSTIGLLLEASFEAPVCFLSNIFNHLTFGRKFMKMLWKIFKS